jgi:amino acid transporter/nucleotide-binding universal stress UspA family protein
MGLLDISMIGIGAMIGAGIFVLSGIASGLAGPACIIAFILNGLINIITGMTYAELGSAYPEAGGGYLWVKKGLPPPFGFVSGWISWFGHTVACSLYSLGFGTYLAWLLEEYHMNPFPADPFFTPAKILAVIMALALLYINYRGTASTGRSEIILTMSKLFLLGIFLVLGGVAMVQNPMAMDNLFGDFFPNGGSGILFAMALTLIAFQGYEVIAQTGEEVKEPKKNIPRAIFMSLIIVTVVYIGMVVVLFGIVTTGMMEKAGVDTPTLFLGQAGASGELALVDVAQAAMGPVGVIVIIMGGLLSTMSALNATIFSSSRVSFAMGRDGTLPVFLGRLHSKRRTPHNALALSGFILIMMVVLFPIKTVAGAADVMFLVLFAITNAAGIALRYKMPHLDRGFKVPLFPLLPILGVVFNIALIYPLYMIEPLAVYIGIIWIMIGGYVHFFTGAKKEILEPPMEMSEMPTLSAEKAARYRVLVPVAAADHPSMVEFAAVVAKENGGDLSLLKIVEVPPNTPTTSVHYRDVSDQIREMEQLESRAKKFDIDVDTRLLVSHEVASTIVEASQKENINLTVLGWKGRTRVGAIMGTNLDRIVPGVTGDVVILKSEGLAAEVKEVTLLYGHGPHVERAAELASIFARKHGASASILLVSVAGWPEAGDAARLAALEDIFRARGVPVTSRTAKHPDFLAGVIAETEGTGLLFMGAAGARTLGRSLFGYLPDRIARGARCPVAIVKKAASPLGP